MEKVTSGQNNENRDESNEGFLKLFVSKQLIHGAAASILGIFVPIFLYVTSGEQFYLVGGYFAVLSLLLLTFLVPGMYLVNRVGFSRSLVLGGLFSMMIYTIMYFLNEENLLLLIVPLTLAVTAFKIFHWIPYHVDFALFTNKGERGRQVSLTFATVALMGVIGPIIAGFVIANFGYEALFGTVIAIMAVATVSYVFVPETPTQFVWSWRETWQNIFSKDKRGIVLGEFANGAEAMVNIVVWPIFLYEVLDGDVFEVGAVSAIVVGATIIIQLLIGSRLDQADGSKEKTLKVGSSLYAFGWILKIFVLSAAQVFFVGLYHNIVKIFTKTPFSAILYDISAEQGNYVDEFTVLREMASHLGRITSLVIVSGLSLFIPIGWTFLIAAIASIAMNLVYRVHNA